MHALGRKEEYLCDHLSHGFFVEHCTHNLKAPVKIFALKCGVKTISIHPIPKYCINEQKMFMTNAQRF